MADASINWNRAALDALARHQDTQQFLSKVGRQVRDEARQSAESISPKRSKAIITDKPREDAKGVYVDVGYDRSRSGFVLWWSEVGTYDTPARPHLRPALRPGLF